MGSAPTGESLVDLTAILTAKTAIDRGLRCTSVEWNSVNTGVHGHQWKPMDKLPQTFNPSVPGFESQSAHTPFTPW